MKERKLTKKQKEQITLSKLAGQLFGKTTRNPLAYANTEEYHAQQRMKRSNPSAFSR